MSAFLLGALWHEIAVLSAAGHQTENTKRPTGGVLKTKMDIDVLSDAPVSDLHLWRRDCQSGPWRKGVGIGGQTQHHQAAKDEDCREQTEEHR